MAAPVPSNATPWLPECAGLQAADFSQSEAQLFDVTSSSWWHSLWPSVIPGLVLGGLAACGFLFLLVWSCVLCWRQRRRKTKLLLDAAALEEQRFISGGQYHSQYFRAPPSRIKRSVTAGRVLKGAIALLALALAGVAAWGLAESIQETNHTVSSFWDVVDSAGIKVENATASLEELDGDLQQLTGALGLLSQQATNASRVLAGLGLSQETITSLRSVPAALRDMVKGLQADVASGIELLRDGANQTLTDLRTKLYHPTMSVEQRWRFIPIAVVFGLTILLALLAGALVALMRWPTWAALSSMLLWAAILALMVLGVALMRGVYAAGQDGCLYLEAFTVRYADAHISSAQDRGRVVAALQYYYSWRDIPDDQVAEVLVGAPTRKLHRVLQSEQVRALLQLVDPSGQDLVRRLGQLVGTSRADQEAILTLLPTVPRLDRSVTGFEQQLLRANVEPMYHQAKEWVCCDVQGSAFDVWVAWTVAGCIGWVLAALCTARIVLHTLGIRRTQKRLEAAQPPAGLPPAYPEVGDSPTPSVADSHRGAAGVVPRAEAAAAATAAAATAAGLQAAAQGPPPAAATHPPREEQQAPRPARRAPLQMQLAELGPQRP